MGFQTPLFMIGGIGFQEIGLILLILVVLFGGKKIPELARGLGRGINEFKTGIKEQPRQEIDEPAPDVEKNVNKDE
jgi:sec-independent protein translocase protein TatA